MSSTDQDSPDQPVSVPAEKAGPAERGAAPDRPGNGRHRGLAGQNATDGPDGRDGREDARAPAQRPGGSEAEDDVSDSTIVLPVPVRARRPEREWAADDDWASDDFALSEDRLDSSVGLTSLGYIRAALRRRARVWLTLALIGLLAGFGYLKERPPAQEASTVLYLANPPTVTAGTAILNDQAYAESLPVATEAVKLLKLHEPPSALMSHYTVTIITDSVLQITAKASSTAKAVAEANALATAFLRFQANLLDSQEKLIAASYNQEIAQAQQTVNALRKQIATQSALPATPANTAELHGLESQHSQATTALNTLNQTVAADEASNQANNAQVIGESKPLNRAVPVASSAKKAIALYVGAGLVGGLALGVGIVIIAALVTDRLRRRDDIARVLGIPVRLSVGRIPVSRWLPGRRGLALARNTNVERVVEHLRSAVRQSTGFPATLAVVPVDDARVPAICLTGLAIACAQQGLHVVLADLYPGTPVGRLLRATEPGVNAVSVDGAELIVVIPDPDDVQPVGPALKSKRGRVPKPLMAASASADVLLSLAHLDPALGGAYLTEWATSLIAIMTAGGSSAGRIYAVGEMISQAKMQTASGVLVDSDKNDESLGVVPEPAGSTDPSFRAMTSRTRTGGFGGPDA